MIPIEGVTLGLIAFLVLMAAPHLRGRGGRPRH